ncbi:hypothetical protein [Bradyrhizobium sp. HKCCYLS20291]
MLLLVGMLMIAGIVTWMGTEYVIDHVVTPLVDGAQTPLSPSP